MYVQQHLKLNEIHTAEKTVNNGCTELGRFRLIQQIFNGNLMLEVEARELVTECLLHVLHIFNEQTQSLEKKFHITKPRNDP